MALCNDRCSFCSKMKILMNPNSDGRCCCRTKSICPLRRKRMASTLVCLSFFLMISLEKWFPDLCVCCFVTSQTVIILFVSMPHCCSTHNKCVCRPVWIMMGGFWLSYLALVKQQAAARLLPTTSVSLLQPEDSSDLHSAETRRSHSVRRSHTRSSGLLSVIFNMASIFSGKSFLFVFPVPTKTKVWKASLLVCGRSPQLHLCRSSALKRLVDILVLVL